MMGLLDDYAQLLTNERQKEKIRGLLGIADTVTGADQIRGIPADPRNWTIDDTAKMLNFAGGGIGAIKTYHGSPHKFDAFDMSKIGTGEGAQAYGHGLYFAESPEVAGQYQKNVTSSQAQQSVDTDPRIRSALRMMQQFGDDAESMLQSAYGYTKEQASDAIAKAKGDYSGNLYNVSLEWPDAAREAADPLGPQHFLDWDKPLSEQPESVKKLIKDDQGLSRYIENKDKWRSEITKKNGKNGSIFVDEFGALREQTGEDFLNAVKGAKNVNSFGFPISKDQNEFSRKYLLDQGIPGIRYLDGGSRGAGDGSYNYVVFDDQIPRIVERNGKPVGLLGK